MSSDVPPPLDSFFAAARQDAPSHAVHDAVWDRVAESINAAAPAVATTAAVKGALSTKLVAIGVLIGVSGATITTVATAAWLAGAEPNKTPTPAPARRHVVTSLGPHGGAKLDTMTVRGRASPNEPVKPPVQIAPDDGSSLAEETRLVTEARAALLGGDPGLALTLARSTARFSTRALEPEELRLEARALRALGRADEALATELKLKTRYPSNTLAR